MRNESGTGKARHKGIAWAAALLTAAALAGCADTSKVAQDRDAAAADDGKLVAQNECSGCHAIGTSGDSPRADAPVFRTILSRYHGNVLEDELVEGIKLGHPDMPRFQLNPRAVSDLLAYLRTIQQPLPHELPHRNR